MKKPTRNTERRKASTPLLLSLALCAGAVAPAMGQSSNEDVKLVPADNDEDDLFGNAVAIKGELALIGAYSDDSLDQDCGAAYVYRFDGQCWIEEAELLASDGSMGDHLGYSLALSEDMALVGAYNECDCWAGAIYVFRYDHQSQTWNEETQLVGPVVQGGDSFASAVASAGDIVLVGAPGDDSGGTDVGAAYVYRYDPLSMTWSAPLKLTASDGASGDLFGTSVALGGDVAIIGAPGDDDSGSWSGSVYVFRYDIPTQSWSQEAKLVASDGAGGDEFGAAVATSIGRVLVGSPWDDDQGPASGSAYVYQYDTGSQSWDQKKKLVASDGAAYAYFGSAVSIFDDRALIGAHDDDENGYKAGAAYVYRDEYGTHAWPL